MKPLFALKSVTFVLVFFVLSTLGCNKNEQSILDIPEPVLAPKILNPKNDKNPYDEVGLIHNQGLDYFVKKFANKKMTT